MKYVRLYADEAGESHFEDVDVPLTIERRASSLSEAVSAKNVVFRVHRPDYQLEFHPEPRRQLVINLGGHIDIEASDGEVRRFGPGSVLLAEDTHGKGHVSRAVNDEVRESIFVVLEDD